MRWFRRMMVLVAVVLVLTMFMMSTLSVFMIFVFGFAVAFFGHRSSPQFEFSEHQYRKYIHCIP